MSELEFRLSKPPIVEAILDIECDMPPGQSLGSLQAKARERYRDRYPKLVIQFFQEHQLGAGPGTKPRLSFRRGIQALRFLQEDEKQLVQVRVQGFSFNRLAPYTSLDEYLPEIERTWQLFVTLVSPTQVRLIRLRYVNRILLPIVDGQVRLEEYLTVAPRLPDEEHLTLVSFLNQHAAVERGSGHQVNIVLTAQGPTADHLPVILDNCVAAAEPREPEDWAGILSKLQALRALQNRVFRSTLTEKCLNRFQ